RDSLREPFALSLLSIETGEKRKLTSPPAQLIGDISPAFSPDGRTLAFSRCIDYGLSDLYLLAFSDGLRPTGEAIFFTAACEKSCNQHGSGFWKKGYVELAFNDRKLAGNAAYYFHLFYAFNHNWFWKQKHEAVVHYHFELEITNFWKQNLKHS